MQKRSVWTEFRIIQNFVFGTILWPHSHPRHRPPPSNSLNPRLAMSHPRARDQPARHPLPAPAPNRVGHAVNASPAVAIETRRRPSSPTHDGTPLHPHLPPPPPPCRLGAHRRCLAFQPSPPPRIPTCRPHPHKFPRDLEEGEEESVAPPSPAATQVCAPSQASAASLGPHT
jgi:hypothetical protein